MGTFDGDKVRRMMVTDALTVTGNFTFGDAAVDTLTVKGGIAFTGTTVTNALKFTGTTGTATDGSLFSTGSTWIDHATANQCAFKILAANSATTGEYATMRIRARSDSTTPTVGGNFSASAKAGNSNYGNLFAVQGYAQPNNETQATSANIVCGVYSCIQATNTSSGRRWSTWIDDHSTTKASGGHYLLRMSDNGTTAKDGAITIYTGGRLNNLFNFEDVAGFLTTATGTATFTHQLACTIAGVGTVYLPLASGIA